MCMLTFFPPDVDPDTDRLWNGTITNNDGHGFAIVTPHEIIVRKDMNPDRLIDQFADMRKHFRGPALFHSRFATDGAIGNHNNHPFYVGNDPLTVVGHNGIIMRSLPRKGDWRSDTRIFAERDLPQRNLNRQRSRNRLAKWIGASKLVILSASDDYPFDYLIVNERDGIWADGIWYSNSGFRPMPPMRYAAAYETDDGKLRTVGYGRLQSIPHSATCKCFVCQAERGVKCVWCDEDIPQPTADNEVLNGVILCDRCLDVGFGPRGDDGPMDTVSPLSRPSFVDRRRLALPASTDRKKTNE